MIFYYLTIAVQIFCCYHAYKNRSEIYWYAIIFLLPVIGCLIYLVLNVLKKNDAQVITEEITTVINPAKKINDLINKVKFSDTFANRVALADAYFIKQEYQKALDNYEVVLGGAHKNDAYVQEQMVMTHYHLKNYEKVIDVARSLKPNSELRASKVHFFLGLSYKELGKLNNAEKQLRSLDVRYSHYPERLVLAQFLIDRDKSDAAIELIEELLIEYSHMSKPNVKLHRSTFAEVKRLQGTLA